MDVRSEYLNFFKSKSHEITPSSPSVPDDATLLSTGTGMVPFKSIFIGEVPRPNPPRETNRQTCIKAGGKHSDLDNVGYTARHHTFFRMLGSFSFEGYSKERATAYAWEFVTETLKLPRDRLYVTICGNDDEAFELQQGHIQKERIHRFGDKDNLQQMGDTGPCGPCSEIFYDQGEEYFNSEGDYMGGDGDRFLEIWNLVFMQYGKSANGKFTSLPKPSINTGMRLERVTAIKEDKFNSFGSSLFMPIIDETTKLCSKTYICGSGASFKVIADHIRSSIFLLAQGTGFGKEGRGCVLRHILRRALRHGYLLGLRKPLMYNLVDVVCKLMGEHYTYLNKEKDFIKEQICLEEERFLSTIENGIKIFNKELKNAEEVFSGEVAFELYDTYGFPLDLTQDMLREKNLVVDEAKFEELMNEQKNRAKASWKGSGNKVASEDFKNLLKKLRENCFVGYEKTEHQATVLALLDEDFKKVSSPKDLGWVMLDDTPSYTTSGGQIADTGYIGTSGVLDTQKFFSLSLGLVKANEEIKLNSKIIAKIDTDKREQTARHHSAAHLLHHALEEILSSCISRAGSSVESNKLRSDFTYHEVLSEEELESIEKRINEMVVSSSEAILENMPLEDTKKSGTITLFNGKYQSNVRVLALGESKELCGGTHVKSTTQIGSFYIVKESGISTGTRRIEAVVSRAALEFCKTFMSESLNLKEEFKNNDLNLGVERLKNEILKLKNGLKNSNKSQLDLDNVNGVRVYVECVESGNIKTVIDEFKNKFEKATILLIQTKDNKITFAADVKDCPLKAGDLVKNITQILGGNGGGRDGFATAGDKDISKIDEALKRALGLIQKGL